MRNHWRITGSRLAGVASLLLLAIFASTLARAQGFPDRAIRIIVPWPAGGITDSIGRVLAQQLSGRVNQAVVVENRAGAAGTIGAGVVARAPADGYTPLLASAETHAIAPNMRASLPYEPLKDFVAIAPFAISSFALIARPDFPAASTRDLIQLIRAQPGKYTYASAGLGSTSQFAMETFKSLAGLDILHVPFQGQAPSIAALMGGQTDLQMVTAGSVAPLRTSGKVKVFAVSTHARFFGMPDVPTLKEEGFESMNFANWFGLVAPAGTPALVAERLAAETNRILPVAQPSLRNLGADVHPSMSSPEFRKLLESELRRWAELIRAAGIKPS